MQIHLNPSNILKNKCSADIVDAELHEYTDPPPTEGGEADLDQKQHPEHQFDCFQGQWSAEGQVPVHRKHIYQLA